MIMTGYAQVATITNCMEILCAIYGAVDYLEKIEIGSIRRRNIRMVDDKGHMCLRCGIKITEEEYETYDGLCENCYEIEVDELDFEDDN